jgi:pimeloyl-ACP methyl ester carboxylesterase
VPRFSRILVLLAATAQGACRGRLPCGSAGKPDQIDQYTLLHLVGDLVGAVSVLGYHEAAIIGHDWGATVAWHAAMFRPDIFRAIAALSVPFLPRSAALPTSTMPETDTSIFYQLHFQQPGVAEREYERDIRKSFVNMLIGFSGDGVKGNQFFDAGMVPREGGLFAAPLPARLPTWIEEQHVDFLVTEFSREGFRGGLNWYRNLDRNWELLAPWADAKVNVPAIYIVGDRDLVYEFPGMSQLISNLKHDVPSLRETVVLQGCGHWTQQERPEEVNAALLAFIKRDFG